MKTADMDLREQQSGSVTVKRLSFRKRLLIISTVVLLVAYAVVVPLVFWIRLETREFEHSLMILYTSMQSRVPDEPIPMSDFPAAYLRSFLEKHPSKATVHDRVVGYIRMVPNPGGYKDPSGGSQELYLFRPAARSVGELAIRYDPEGNVAGFRIAKLSYLVPDKFSDIPPD